MYLKESGEGGYSDVLVEAEEEEDNREKGKEHY